MSDLNLESIAKAAMLLANAWSGTLLADDMAGRLACSEFEPLSDLFKACGKADAAQLWLECHAAHDDEPTDQHYNLFSEVSA